MGSPSPQHILGGVIARARGMTDRASNRSSRRDLSKDLAFCLEHFSLCRELAFQRSVARYRRTFLGALWIPLSFALMVTTMAMLWSTLFNRPFAHYMPHMALGLFVWNILQGALTEGARSLIDGRSMVLQTAAPSALFPFVAVLKNVLLSMNHLPFVFAILVAFAPPPTPVLPLAFLGLLLVVLTAVAVAICLSVICAYSPDFAELIGAGMRFIFFFTPILWMTETRHWAGILLFNPFYHLLEVVRAPLLKGDPVWQSFAIAGGMTVFSWTAAVFIYRRWAAGAATRL